MEIQNPLTPIRRSRVVERAELQHLNNRLASYIDRKNHLEKENEHLRSLHDREIANLKQVFEVKLSEKLKSIEELTSEKTKMEIDYRQSWDEKQRIQVKYDKMCKKAQIAKKNARMFEAKINESNNITNEMVAERDKHLKSIADAKNLEQELRKQLAECQTNLQNVTAARIDLDAAVQSLREQIQFKDQIHQEELNESKAHSQMDITEHNSSFQALQEIRGQCEDVMRSQRIEMMSLFDTGINNRQNSPVNENKTGNVEVMNLKIGELERINLALSNRIRQSQLSLADEHTMRTVAEAEVNRLRDEMVLQMKKYQDFMDTKVSFGLELSAYRKCLSSVDHRLNTESYSANVDTLSQSFTRTLRGLPAAKRYRYENFETVYDYVVTTSSAGDVEITEIDPAVKFIKLHNKGQNDVSLKGWQLIRNAGAIRTVHKFDCLLLGGGGELVIWSSNSEVSASPGNIITESKWFAAENTKITLINQDGNEEASAEHIRQQRLPDQSDDKNGKKCTIM